MNKKQKEWSLRLLSTIQPVAVSWLAYPYIPENKFILLIGDPGLGKSTLAINIAAALTTGRPILESESEPQTGSVIYLSAEDKAEDTLVPRFMAAGANLDKVAIIECAGLNISEDLDIFDSAIRDMNAKLICVDPLQGYIGPDADMTRAADMRRLLGGLARIAEKRGCAVLAIGHMSKATGSKSLYRSLGSIDIAASARGILLVERSENDPDIRMISHIKSSLAPEGKPLAFCFEPGSSIRFVDEYESEYDNIAIFEDNKREWASNTILTLLSDGPKSGADIQRICADAGISESTVNRAKKDLGIRSVRKPDGWDWTLGKHESSKM